MSRTVITLAALWVGSLGALSGAGCAAPEPAIAGPPQAAWLNRDSLLGCYLLDGDTLIPVFRCGDGYCSVSRGFELPLDATTDGLAWGILPSSMDGTTIGVLPTGDAFIAIHDDMAWHNSDGNYGGGEHHPLARVECPAGCFAARSSPPESIDDFVGWYLAVWQPQIAIEVRRDGVGFTGCMHLYENQAWQPESESVVLTALPDRLGLDGFEPGENPTLEYNPELRRFELLLVARGRVLRMPLVRHAQPVTPPPFPFRRMGIPTWH